MADKKHLKGGEREQCERQVEYIRSFLDDWQAFLAMMRAAHRGRDITREDEAEFLKLKSQIAQRHQYMLNWIERDYLEREAITPLLRSCVTLGMIRGYDQEFYQKIEKQWHTTFIRLQLTLGHYRYLLDEEFS